MQKPNETFHVKAVIDFIPAELKMNKEWTIVYRCKDPFKNQLKRYVVRVPKHSNTKERKALAQRMCAQINQKLQTGWNPMQNSGRSFETMNKVLEDFITQTKKEVANGSKRVDTFRSYNSYINQIKKYCQTIDKITFAGQLSKVYIIKYLDYKFAQGNSSVCYNNHLNFWGNLCGWMQMREIIPENYQRGIPRKKKTTKKRQVIDPQTKATIKEKLQEFNFNYYALCMATYYCFIRGTELTKLKVMDVNLKRSYIYIQGDSSKNCKSESVTIPKAFKEILEKHLENAKPSDWLFSHDDFKPGKTQLKPKKISDTWNKIRTLADFGLEYQFYSLKDSGISDMLRAGVPSIKVRDQARHHDLKITELYTNRNIESDREISDLNFDF
jgi:integrase/recombinase XerD